MVKRIGYRILGLGILLIIVFIIIPLISDISDFISKTPSWILISGCCFGGTLIFGVLYVIGNQTNQNQEKKKEIIDVIKNINSDALKIFDSKLNENPIKTKEDYLKLKDKFKYFYELYVPQPDLNAPKKLELNEEELDLVRSLFDECPIRKIDIEFYEKGLIYHMGDHIRSFELAQEAKALEAFEKRLEEDPEGTVDSFKKLREALTIYSFDPALSLNLSKELFGEAMLIDGSSIGHIYSKKSSEFQAIEEPKIISRALKVYKNKMAENPEQVIKDCNELLPLLEYLRNPVYHGAPGRGEVCQKVFSLSEKIFEERIDYYVLFKITDNINQK